MSAPLITPAVLRAQAQSYAAIRATGTAQLCEDAANTLELAARGEFLIDAIRREYEKCKGKWGQDEPAALETLERLFSGAIWAEIPVELWYQRKTDG